MDAAHVTDSPAESSVPTPWQDLALNRFSVAVAIFILRNQSTSALAGNKNLSTDTNNTVLSSLLRIISGVFTLFVVWHLFKLLGKTSRLPDYEASVMPIQRL